MDPLILAIVILVIAVGAVAGWKIIAKARYKRIQANDHSIAAGRDVNMKQNRQSNEDNLRKK